MSPRSDRIRRYEKVAARLKPTKARRAFKPIGMPTREFAASTASAGLVMPPLRGRIVGRRPSVAAGQTLKRL